MWVSQQFPLKSYVFLFTFSLLYAIIAGARQAGGRGPRDHRLLQEVHRPLEVVITVPLSFS